MKLNDEELLTAPTKAKVYKIYDGQGLFAEVPPRGNIRWRFKYRFGGKEKKLSLGVYPKVSIIEARNRLAQLRALLELGVDPSVDRRESKANHHSIVAEFGALLQERQYTAQRLQEYEEYTAILKTTLVSLKETLSN